MKNPNDIIEIRTRDLPSCSMVRHRVQASEYRKENLVFYILRPIALSHFHYLFIPNQLHDGVQYCYTFRLQTAANLRDLQVLKTNTTFSKTCCQV